MSEARGKEACSRDVCVWKQNDEDGAWDTQCGNRFELLEGDPLQNNMAFCPYCGKLLGMMPNV